MAGYASILTAIIAFGVTTLLGFLLIPILRKLKFGQTIKEIGPTWHKDKQGTPTMGGLMFIGGIVLAVAIGYIVLRLSSAETLSEGTVTAEMRFWAGIVMALAYGFVGFVDDYIKVVKKRNLGLNAKQKLVMQFLIAATYLLCAFLAGDNSTVVPIPFIGQLNLGIFYYPIMMFVIVGAVNAVNLTDGVDGLASSVTFVVGIAFIFICSILDQAKMGLLAVALAAGCVGFLVWNFHPAKVFMGDTGSMFLGGMVVALAFGAGNPVILVLVGIIYVVEALSDILQVGSYKLTHKRIFKMAPIHHHFEMSGWSENKIVFVFSAVTLVFGGLAVLSVVLSLN